MQPQLNGLAPASQLIRQSSGPDDRAAVASLLAREVSGYERERFQWIHEDRAGAASRCLVAQDAGAAVGTVSLVRRQFAVDGAPIASGQPVDFVVAKSHRYGALAVSLQRSLLNDAASQQWSLLYGFPNRQSEGVLLRVGYRRLGYMRRWFRPLASDDLPVARRIVQFVPGLLLAAGSRLGDGVTRLMSFGSGRRERECEATAVERFDSRFDELWSRCRSRYRVVGDRTAAYLSWRFERRPGVDYRVLAIADRHKVLHGYAVWSPRARTANVSDLLADSPGTLRRLLDCLVQRLRVERVTGVSLVRFGGPGDIRGLYSSGFVPRGRGTPVLTCWTGPGTMPEALGQPRNWYLTEADRDG